MKRAMSILLIAAAAGVTSADTPDKFVEYVESSGVLEPLGSVEGLLEGLPLTIGPGGFVVDTAGRNASLGNFTVTSGGELVKTGEGTLAMTSLPALEKISLANGALTVAAEAASLDALDLATGTRCDLGGGALACGVLAAFFRDQARSPTARSPSLARSA